MNRWALLYFSSFILTATGALQETEFNCTLPCLFDPQYSIKPATDRLISKNRTGTHLTWHPSSSSAPRGNQTLVRTRTLLDAEGNMFKLCDRGSVLCCFCALAEWQMKRAPPGQTPANSYLQGPWDCALPCSTSSSSSSFIVSWSSLTGALSCRPAFHRWLKVQTVLSPTLPLFFLLIYPFPPLLSDQAECLLNNMQAPWDLPISLLLSRWASGLTYSLIAVSSAIRLNIRTQERM